MILPDAMLGILGGGQLGRMFTVAARTMGYRVTVLDPDPASPAGALADAHLCAPYTDQAALAELAGSCAAVTTEFENVPAESMAFLAERCIVRPAAQAVAVTQDRIHEKNFLRAEGFPTTPFAVIHTRDDLAAAFSEMDGPALLKISRFGYDGKGQARVESRAEAASLWSEMGGEACVLESLLPLACELSVVLARGPTGEVASYPVAENQHHNGILDVSIVPARISETLSREAEAMAVRIAERLDYCGVMAVEFFVLADGRLVINEIAPRPHNSGHYTLDACLTSQFEQQVRALCGLPLGDTRLLAPVAMLNLLGDVWCEDVPRWEVVFACPQAKLHLYGKREARPGRKMGHVNILGQTVADVLAQAQSLRDALRCPERHGRGGAAASQ